MQKLHPYLNDEERKLYNIVEEFRDTLFIPTVEKVFKPENFQRCCDILKNSGMKTFTGRTGTDVTFGDMAALLAEWYQEPRTGYDARADLLAAAIGTFLEVYLLDCNEERVPQSVRDFLCMPFEAFYRFAKATNALSEACDNFYTEHAKHYDLGTESVQGAFRNADAELTVEEMMHDDFSGEFELEKSVKFDKLVCFFINTLATLQAFPLE